MQKSHDHDLTDPTDPGFDGILLQVREPVVRALSNYELDLRTVGPAHSIAYMRFWLGLEAAYTVGFLRKWCLRPDPRSFILKYEDLLAEPVTYYRRLFARFALPREAFDPEAVSRAQSVSSGDGKPFRERDLRGSRHFDAPSLAAFQALVASAAAELGYRPHPDLMGSEAASEAVTLAFEAKRALLQGQPDRALAALDRYVLLSDAHVFGRRTRAGILMGKGELAAARAELDATIQAEPTHARAYVDLAQLLMRLNERNAAQATLRSCLSLARDPERAGQLIRRSFAAPELRALAEAHVPQPAVTREDVVNGFRFILGREPEDERVIEAHQRVGSLAELREILLRSAEFAEKYGRLLRPTR